MEMGLNVAAIKTKCKNHNRKLKPALTPSGLTQLQYYYSKQIWIAR